MVVSKYLIHILKEDRKNILNTWEQRASQEVSSIYGSPLVLQSKITKVMASLDDALEEVNQGESLLKVQEILDQTKINLRPENYSSDQVLFEYHLFKEVLFEKLENSLPLRNSESDILLTLIDHAVLAA